MKKDNFEILVPNHRVAEFNEKIGLALEDLEFKHSNQAKAEIKLKNEVKSVRDQPVFGRKN